MTELIQDNFTAHGAEELLIDLLTEKFDDEFPAGGLKTQENRIFHRWVEDIFDNSVTELQKVINTGDIQDLYIYIKECIMEKLYDTLIFREDIDFTEYTYLYQRDLDANHLELLKEYVEENNCPEIIYKGINEIKLIINHYATIEVLRDEAGDWAEIIADRYYGDYQVIIKNAWNNYKLKKRITALTSIKKSQVHICKKLISSYL